MPRCFAHPDLTAPPPHAAARCCGTCCGASRAALSAAGGAQKRGDVQRARGQLRLVDEHPPAGGHLHVKGARRVQQRVCSSAALLAGPSDAAGLPLVEAVPTPAHCAPCKPNTAMTSPQDGDRFFRMPEVYIRGNTIKYVRVPDEVRRRTRIRRSAMQRSDVQRQQLLVAGRPPQAAGPRAQARTRPWPWTGTTTCGSAAARGRPAAIRAMLRGCAGGRMLRASQRAVSRALWLHCDKCLVFSATAPARLAQRQRRPRALTLREPPPPPGGGQGEGRAGQPER